MITFSDREAPACRSTPPAQRRLIKTFSFTFHLLIHENTAPYCMSDNHNRNRLLCYKCILRYIRIDKKLGLPPILDSFPTPATSGRIPVGLSTPASVGIHIEVKPSCHTYVRDRIKNMKPIKHFTLFCARFPESG